MVTLEEARTRHVHELDAPFIDEQRQRLTELRQTLLTVARNAADERIGVNVASAGGAREYEEDAQNLTMLETEEELEARTAERLTRVERALAKIAEGTYGFSDLSAQPIPRERLVTVPEAACTLEEEEAIENSAIQQPQ
jgi:DnaK suppressor protein